MTVEAEGQDGEKKPLSDTDVAHVEETLVAAYSLIGQQSYTVEDLLAMQLRQATNAHNDVLARYNGMRVLALKAVGFHLPEAIGFDGESACSECGVEYPCRTVKMLEAILDA